MRLHNEERNTLTITPYNVAYQLYSVYGQVTNGNWNAETALQAIAHSTLKNIPHTEEGCVDALNYLNYKLESVRKTISFWDAYQISDSIEDSDVVLSKLTQLPNNSALINNTTDPFIWTNPNIKIDQATNRTAIEVIEEKVYQGDIFIKDYQGNIHLIHATNKGVYVPKNLLVTGQGNSVTIEYQYVSSGSEPQSVLIPPQSPELTVGTNGHWYIDGQDTNIPATSPTSGPTGMFNLEEDSAYNIRGTLSPCQSATFSVLFGPTDSSLSSIIIAPIVKFFNQQDQVTKQTAYSGPYNESGLVDPTTITTPTTGLWWKVENETIIDLDYEVR